MSKTNSAVLFVLLVFCFASFVVPGCGGGGSSGGGGGYSSAGGGGYDPISPTPTSSPTASPTPTTSPIPTGMARIIVTFQQVKTAKALTGYLYQQGTTDPIQTFQLVNNQATLDVYPGWYRIVIDDNGVLYYDPSPTEYFYIGVGEERSSIPVIYIPPSPPPSPSPTTSPPPSPSPSPSPTETPGPGPQPQPTPTPTPTPTPSPSPSPSPTLSPTMGKITVHLSNFNCMGNLYKEGVYGVFLTFELKNGTGSLTVSPGNYRVEVNYLGSKYYDPTSSTYFTILAGDDYQSYPAP